MTMGSPCTSAQRTLGGAIELQSGAGTLTGAGTVHVAGKLLAASPAPCRMPVQATRPLPTASEQLLDKLHFTGTIFAEWLVRAHPCCLRASPCRSAAEAEREMPCDDVLMRERSLTRPTAFRPDNMNTLALCFTPLFHQIVEAPQGDRNVREVRSWGERRGVTARVLHPWAAGRA